MDSKKVNIASVTIVIISYCHKISLPCSDRADWLSCAGYQMSNLCWKRRWEYYRCFVQKPCAYVFFIVVKIIGQWFPDDKWPKYRRHYTSASGAT